MKLVYILLMLTSFVLNTCTSGNSQFARFWNKLRPQQQETIGMKVLTHDEFRKKIKEPGIQLIDVRTPEEYKAGHIEGARNIDFYDPDFKTNLSQLDKNKPVLLYCRTNNRSYKTSLMLKSMGFREIYDMQGGYSTWKE